MGYQDFLQTMLLLAKQLQDDAEAALKGNTETPDGWERERGICTKRIERMGDVLVMMKEYEDLRLGMHLLEGDFEMLQVDGMLDVDAM